MAEEIFSTSRRQKIYRLVDANVNRAREGLRVLEDVARFIYSDKSLTLQVRYCRHELDKVFRRLYPELIAARRSKQDIGRVFQETGRTDIVAVVRANCKRVEESLRVLEEFTKLLSADRRSTFKQLRYKIYDLEKEFQKRVLYDPDRNGPGRQD